MDVLRTREDARSIFNAGLKRVDPEKMIGDLVTLEGDTLSIRTGLESFRFDLSKYSRIVVIGTGKATARMARAVEQILGNRISLGLISVKRGHTEKLSLIETIEAGHPVPDGMSIQAAKRIAGLCIESDERTLIINLVSGGGSALLSFPLEIPEAGISLTLEEKQETTKILLSCGATIREINCIRKHISAIKGGRLARLMYPAESVNLILSDVVGDGLDSIASGLTAFDGTTYGDAAAIVRKYGLERRLPGAILDVLKKGSDGLIPETPKENDPAFKKVHNILIGTNLLSLLSAEVEAVRLGYNTLVLSSQITGEAREIAKFYLGLAREVAGRGIPVKRPACIIAGGETTVTIRGEGKGGRNQEMALSFLSELSSTPADSSICFLSGATDGNDGPTDAAGAFADAGALAAARAANLDIQDFLSRNDSYRFYEQVGLLLKTGPTNTNVCDIQIMLIP